MSLDNTLGDVLALSCNMTNSKKICGLSSMCRKLVQAVEGEGEKYPEVYKLIRTYLNRMFKIVLKEKNTDVRRKELELLHELDKGLPINFKPHP